MFRVVTSADPWLEGRRPWVRLLAEAAEALGGTLEMEPTFGHIGRFTPRSGPSRPLFGNALGLNSDASAHLAADKDYTARCLSAAGLPAARGVLAFSPNYQARMALKNTSVAAKLSAEASALRFAETCGYPVIAKPNDGSEGRGIHRATSPRELQRDLETLFLTDDKVRIEPLYRGVEHRLLVLDGKVALAYRREPAKLTADGSNTVGVLLDRFRATLETTLRGPKLDPQSPSVLRTLAVQGLTLDSCPVRGTEVTLVPNSNLSTGGTLHDLTGALGEEAEDLAIEAARVLGLRMAGVDVLASDLRCGPDGAVILEVNSSPGLDGYASAGAGHWRRARAVVEQALAAQDTCRAIHEAPS